MWQCKGFNLGRVFGISLSFLIFLIIFQHVPYADIMAIIRRTDVGYLSVAIIIALLNHIFFSVDKLRRIVCYTGHRLSFDKALVIKVGGSTLDVFVPFRLGDVLKAKYLNIDNGQSIASALGVLVFDKALNLWAIFVLLFVGLLFLPMQVPLFLPGVILIGLIVVIWFNKLWGMGCVLLSRVHVPAGEILKQFACVFFSGSYQKKGFLCGYALLIQMLEVSLFYLIFLSLGIKIPLAYILTGSALVIAISAVPVAFLGIGVREVAVTSVFALYASPEVLLSAGLLVTVVGHLITRMVGFILFPRFMAETSLCFWREKKL